MAPKGDVGQDGAAVGVDVDVGGVSREVADAHAREGRIDGRDDREAAVRQATDREDRVARAGGERDRGDVEGDVGRAGGADLEIVLTSRQVEVAGVVGVGEVLDHHVATVEGDVDGRGVEAEVDDAHLRALGGGGGGVGEDLRDDAGGQAAGGGDRGHRAGVEGERLRR